MSGFCTLFAVSCQPRHQGGTLGSLTDPFLLQDSESRSSFRPSPTDSHRPVLNRVYSRTTPVAQLLRTGCSPPVALHGNITAPQLLSVTDGRTPVGWGLPPHHVDAFTGALAAVALRLPSPRRAGGGGPVRNDASVRSLRRSTRRYWSQRYQFHPIAGSPNPRTMTSPMFPSLHPKSRWSEGSPRPGD